jgi:hypothetical protein
MRRRTLLVALAGLAVVAAGVVVFWPRQTLATAANFARIQEGMTRAEVEDLVGPAGDFRTRPMEYSWGESARLEMYQQIDDETIVWATNEVLGVVRLDPAGRVSKVVYGPGRAQSQSVLENLLWRAKRQWHRWFP